MKSKWEQAIDVLVEKTQDGELKWEFEKNIKGLEKEDIRGPILQLYNSEFSEDSFLLLYKVAKYEYVTGGSALAQIMGQTKEIKTYEPELVIFDRKIEMIVYTFPYSIGIEDLYNAATFQAAGVENMLKNILSQAKEEDIQF